MTEQRPSFTVSMIGRRADIPWRTAQRWADENVLVPQPTREADAAKMFDLRELEIAKMLRPFTQFSAPIDALKLLAETFRDKILSDDLPDVPLERVVRAARTDRQAYLVVKVILTRSGVPREYEAILFPTLDGQALCETITEATR